MLAAPEPQPPDDWDSDPCPGPAPLPPSHLRAWVWVAALSAGLPVLLKPLAKAAAQIAREAWADWRAERKASNAHKGSSSD